MPRYLLTCDCGEVVPVELGQAGGHVVCRCGKSLAVPALRSLRELPVEQDKEVAVRRTWHPRYGVTAICLIVALGLGSASLWIHLTEPKPPVFNTAESQKMLDEAMDDMTPAVVWHLWMLRHAKWDEGLTVDAFQLPPKQKEIVKENRFLKKALLVPMGLMLAIAAVSAFCPWAKK
jgi:hypothetical protein